VTTLIVSLHPWVTVSWLTVFIRLLTSVFLVYKIFAKHKGYWLSEFLGFFVSVILISGVSDFIDPRAHNFFASWVLV
jgi:hypothetical protein